MPGVAAAQNVTRGPYLQLATHTSVVVLWRTDSPTSSRVRYGSAAAKLDRSVTSSALVTRHALTISGLAPGATYFYAVGDGARDLAGGTEEYTFRTSPAAGAAGVRFWVAGDSRASGSQGMAYANKVTDAMLSYTAGARPDLFLNTGDMVDSGQDAEFQTMFFTPYAGVLRNTVCLPTLGNHDVETGPSPAYYEAFVLPTAGEAGGVASGTESYYSYDHANVHFVVLNSETEDRGVDKPMLTWLAKDLATTKQTWIVAQWHHAPYSKWGHDSDDKDKDLAMVQMRERAVPIVEAAGVDLLLFGHSHVYSRTALVSGAHETPTPVDVSAKVLNAGDGSLLGAKGPYVKSGKAGAVYIVAGHGGTDLHDPPDKNHPLTLLAQKQHGSCVVTVDRGVLRLVNLLADGKVSDRFTMVKGKALVLDAPDGGETYAPGQQVTVRWAFVGTEGTPVKLELSTDGGDTWSTVAAYLSKTAHAWTVPPAVTSRGRLRVTSTTDATLRDQSDGLFSIGARTEVVSLGHTWRYSDDGTDHDTAWRAPGFDDTKWKSGPGQLGYGDGDESTVLLNPDPNYPSVYFRKQVDIPAAVASARLSVVHDDGVAVWINGALAFSEHVANGTGYAAWASTSSEENELSTQELPGAVAKGLKVGKNTIAVMIKQVNGASSDVSFDLSMTVTYVKQRPVFSPVPVQKVAEQQKLSLQVQASHPAGNPLTYSTGKLPAGATFDATARRLDWTPPAGSAGAHSVIFLATDPVGQQASLVVAVEVTPGPGGADAQRPGLGEPSGGGPVGCGCRAADSGPPWTMAPVLGLLLWRRRRRRVVGGRGP